MAALRTNDSYLQALYRRKRSSLGHGRAVGAVKHSMICACWHMLATGSACGACAPLPRAMKMVVVRCSW